MKILKYLYKIKFYKNTSDVLKFKFASDLKLLKC